MGSSTTWEQQTTEPLAWKKRKRDIEDQKSRNSAVYRYVNPHSYPRCLPVGKELLPSAKAVCGQPSADYARQASAAPNPRPRLRPVLAKRRRIEHPQEGCRPASVLRDVTQDELKLYDTLPIAHDPVSPSSEETPFPPLLQPSSDSPASTHLRAPHKQQPQVQQHTTTSTRQSNPRHHHDSDLSTTALSPCHICHRRPTTRSVLDGYADCNLCGERTCYICLRECLSPHCRAVLQSATQPRDASTGPNDVPKDPSRDIDGRRVCSSCAVEGVTEYGEDIVWCLDCVEQDREMETGGL